MQLSSALAPLANPGTRARGADYARSGAIVHFDPAPTFVYAVVRGGDDYVVRLDLAGRDVRGSCSCPYFADHLELCKHLWAGSFGAACIEGWLRRIFGNELLRLCHIFTENLGGHSEREINPGSDTAAAKIIAITDHACVIRNGAIVGEQMTQ